jgi:EF hand domain-containing protein
MGMFGRMRLARQLPLLKVTAFSNRGHIMKKATRFIVAGAATLLPFAAAFAQSPTPEQTTPEQAPPTAPSEQAPQSKGATFESLDTNSDGKISKEEAAANANVSAQFARYDVNGDGFIERAEVGQANGAKSPQQ